MNSRQKIAQIHGAVSHVLRKRMAKKAAYDDNWVEYVQYLAETGQLAPESIKQIKKLHDRGLLSKIFHGAAGEAANWGLGTAIASSLLNGALGGISGGSVGQGLLQGAALGGGLGLGLGTLTGGIGAGLNYRREKEQLKSILDKLPPGSLEEALGQAQAAPTNSPV